MTPENNPEVAAPRADDSTKDSARPRNFSSKEGRWLLALAAVYCIALVSSLGLAAFVGPDEPRYAQVAREMFSSGDFISTRLCGLLWFEKPVLFYWLAAASYSVFGVGEFAARVPSAVAALGTVAMLWFVAKRCAMPIWGAMSAAVLATSVIWIGFSHAASPDMLLSASISIALLAAWLSLETEGRERLRLLLFSAAFVGLAMLAKGLVGVLFVIIILGLHGVVARRFVFRSAREFLAAVAVFLLVAGLWYIPVTLRHGGVFIEEFFINHHFKRYLTNKYQHPQASYYYLLVAFAGTLPWSFLLLPAIGRLGALRPRHNARDSLLALAWIWLVFTIGFFSLSTSKLPGYILPAFPAFALVLGAQAERLWNGERTFALKIAALLNALAITLLLVGAELYLQKKGMTFPGGNMLLALPVVVGILVGVAFVRGATRSALIGPAAVVFAFVIGANFILPRLNSSLGDREWALRVASLLRPNENIVFYKAKKKYAHAFYSNGRIRFYFEGRPIQGMSSGDDIDIDSRSSMTKALASGFLTNPPTVVFVTRKRWRHFLEKDTRITIQEIAEQDEDIAFRIARRSN